MESLIAKYSYIVPGILGAVVYIIRGDYTVKQSVAILLSGVSMATFAAPAIVEYLGISNPQYISLIAFLFGLSGMVLSGGIVDYIKDPKFIKEFFSRIIKAK